MRSRGTETAAPDSTDIEIFKGMIDEYRYDFERLVYMLFPFGQKGHALEHMAPYEWQMEEWRKMSSHLMNPKTRYNTYRLIISSGNGAAKTAFGAMTTIMLMYTQQLRARLTANTEPQLRTVIWPEYDVWFRHARFNDVFFEKLGTSIKAKAPELGEVWRLDMVTWSENNPASISGLHNKGRAMAYIFEEGPGIPAVIWGYASGAYTETETIKIWMAFGNSDDPDSKFEQNMTSPLWHSKRIDTRTLKHIAPDQIAAWLLEAGGDEDADEFRVRVRGLPRKSNKDSIISKDLVTNAMEACEGFDKESVAPLPVILGCDPAWTGGDETVIWMRQGNYAKILERYKLDKEAGQTHMYTYQKLCKWEKTLGADAVFIDQGEGTAIYTLSMNDGKYWELVAFGSRANDTPEFKDSQYGNLRAQMYYNAKEWLMKGGVIDSGNKDWDTQIVNQISWTKGTRHRVHNKKMAESKVDIKARVGQSPDIADGFVILFARPVTERLPENDRYSTDFGRGNDGSYKLPELPDPYEDVEYVDIY